jgi:hypothetical protein
MRTRLLSPNNPPTVNDLHTLLPIETNLDSRNLRLFNASLRTLPKSGSVPSLPKNPRNPIPFFHFPILTKTIGYGIGSSSQELLSSRFFFTLRKISPIIATLTKNTGGTPSKKVGYPPAVSHFWNRAKLVPEAKAPPVPASEPGTGFVPTNPVKKKVDSLMVRWSQLFVVPAFAAAFSLLAAAAPARAQAGPPAQQPDAAAPSAQAPPAPAQAQTAENTEKPPTDSGVGRGKKLVLKDGSFQIIREYQRNGDRVRYYSLERADWEELPAAMIDWDATAKANAAQEKAAESLVQKVHHQQEEYRTDMPLDIDASLEVAPNTFLPPGEGMFVVEGKSVIQLEQVAAQQKTDKKQFLKQILTPVPIVPGKQNIQIPGAHATLRVNSANPEFYLREAPPDPDRRSPIRKSSRPGENGPEIVLVRAEVKGDSRRLESIESLFGQQVGDKVNTISVQQWQIAQNVFRYTLSQQLPPGEYALAEILPDGMNLYVWDFGVDDQSKAKR